MNIELRWWQYSRHRAETRFAVAYGALNLAYLSAALAGAFYWPKFRWAMLGYIILRSLLLLTVAPPEPRYTLECYPLILAFAALAVDRWSRSAYKTTSASVTKNVPDPAEERPRKMHRRNASSQCIAGGRGLLGAVIDYM